MNAYPRLSRSVSGTLLGLSMCFPWAARAWAQNVPQFQQTKLVALKEPVFLDVDILHCRQVFVDPVRPSHCQYSSTLERYWPSAGHIRQSAAIVAMLIIMATVFHFSRNRPHPF